MSEREKTQLVFEGLIDSLGATMLRQTIIDADERMKRNEYDGSDIAIDADDGEDDFFATIVHVDPTHVSLSYGEDPSTVYSLTREVVDELIDARLTET